MNSLSGANNVLKKDKITNVKLSSALAAINYTEAKHALDTTSYPRSRLVVLRYGLMPKKS